MWSALAAIAPAALSYLGGERRNQSAERMADTANAFSAQQFATRYQTTTKDMMAAGLNPMLAYQQGGGAPPTGQQGQVPSNPLGEAASAYLSTKLQQGQIDLLEAQSRAASAQAAKTEAETGYVAPLAGAQIDLHHSSAGSSRQSIDLMRNQADKIVAEIKNIPSEGARLRAAADNLDQSSALMKQQGLTEIQRRAQLSAMAYKVLNEAGLLELDLEAAKSSDNFGRISHEYRYAIDVLEKLIPDVSKLFKKGRTRSNTTRYDKHGNPSGGSSTETLND
jgi:hypothetical protein